jgi:translation elongation factor EF-Ts
VLESSDAVGNLGQRLSVHIAGMRPASAAELLEQQFAALGAGSGTVGDELKKRRAKLIDFVRIEVGEGVEVKSEDYAASVQEVLKGKQ